MGFLSPKVPKVVQTPVATPAVQAQAGEDPSSSITANPGSMISTSSQGLTRKARTQKPSLIGGSGSAN
jgi:hypothetical protein